LSLDDGQACTSAKEIGEHKLADVRQRIQTLQALESALQKLVAQCATSKRKVSCPLIESLMRSDVPLTAVDRR
jgi:MerR family mercuric resistance operon transcriptional regulator